MFLSATSAVAMGGLCIKAGLLAAASVIGSDTFQLPILSVPCSFSRLILLPVRFGFILESAYTLNSFVLFRPIAAEECGKPLRQRRLRSYLTKEPTRR